MLDTDNTLLIHLIWHRQRFFDTDSGWMVNLYMLLTQIVVMTQIVVVQGVLALCRLQFVLAELGKRGYREDTGQVDDNIEMSSTALYDHE